MIDMLSRKKRDTMLSIAAPGTNPQPNVTPSVPTIRINASTTTTTFLAGVHTFCFIPSQRFLVPNNADFVAARTSTRPYYVGLKERYTLVPNDASLWWHRRIVFASKTQYFESTVGLATNGVVAAQPDATTTTTRKFRDMSSDLSSTYSTVATALVTDIFLGIYTTDWNDPMRAALDKARITVLSDRLVTVKSNNDSPAPKICRHYTPIKKTLVYQDEENGNTMSVSPFSVNSKAGIGNIYVIDLFECPAPIGTTTSALTISSEQTLYWHEK